MKVADLPDLCASFQAAIVDVLAAKLLKAARQSGHHILAVSGGVSANSFLRQTLHTQAERAGLELLFPPPDLLTDNALIRVELDGDRYVGEERLLVDLLPYIRDVRQGPDGLLYIVTHTDSGGLYRLEPA
jgi:N6-L-threonylcarbamoyladenine synthase